MKSWRMWAKGKRWTLPPPVTTKGALTVSPELSYTVTWYVPAGKSGTVQVLTMLPSSSAVTRGQTSVIVANESYWFNRRKS